MQLKLNPVFGNHLHSGLSIAQIPNAPVTTNMVTVTLAY